MSDKTPLEVWSVRDAAERGKPAFWKHCGRAYVNQDGSINVLLDVLPMNGKLQIRKRKEAEVGADRAGGAPRPTSSAEMMQAGFPSSPSA
jgi:hypothetical protein